MSKATLSFHTRLSVTARSSSPSTLCASSFLSQRRWASILLLTSRATVGALSVRWARGPSLFNVMLMEDRWADMVGKEVLARLAGVLYMLAESEGVMTPEGPMIPTRYTHAQLASMIGANREAVTRAIGELREGGCVEVKRRRVYVRDLDALRRDAGE